MALIDYFQKAKCPACKQKLQAKALQAPKLFSNQPVRAGQCHECKTELQWIRSWRKTLIMAACGAVGVVLATFVIVMIKGSGTLRMAQILGAGIGVGFVAGKELSVAQTAKPSSE